MILLVILGGGAIVSAVGAISGSIYVSYKKKKMYSKIILSNYWRQYNISLAQINEMIDTPLHLACVVNDEAVVRLLLSEKTRDRHVNAVNVQGMTPLLLATLHCHLNLATLLLNNNANPNIANREGQTPLHIAASNNCVDIVKLLIKFGARINSTDNKRNTPIQSAIILNNVDIVNILTAIKRRSENDIDDMRTARLKYFTQIPMEGSTE